MFRYQTANVFESIVAAYDWFMLVVNEFSEEMRK